MLQQATLLEEIPHMPSEYVVIVNFPIDCSDMTVAELKNEAKERFRDKAYLEHWTVENFTTTHMPEQATIRIKARIQSPVELSYTTFEI